MNSKEQIKENLTKIAESHNLSGESVELIIDLLTYALYHEQIEVLSTAKELSLNDAMLINSKIALCCNNMYSVYRGRNPRILIKAKVESQLNKSKFDKLYESNSFRIYSAEPRSLNATDNIVELEGIISKDAIKVITKPVEYHDQYYIDLKTSDGQLLSNLSEDIIVSIAPSVEGGKYKEYKTTRIFSDHCRSFGDNEEIFVLTIPDYGIRLYKKNKFSKGEIVEVRVIPYTTIDDINESELNKVTIPGTTTQVYDPSTGLKYALIDQIPRQDVDSFMYDVNFAGRVNHEIQSNSDVAYLFREVFIDKVTSATYEYLTKDKTGSDADLLKIYYVDRLLGNPQVTVNGEVTERGEQQIITDPDKQDFIANYYPYFLTGNMEIVRAREVELTMNVTVVTDDTISIQQKVDKIMSNYSYKLETTINRQLIISEISKIDNVKYVKNLSFEDIDDSQDIKSGIDGYFTITSNVIFSQE